MDSAGAIDFDFRRARKRVCTVEEASERLLTGAPSLPPESAYPGTDSFWRSCARFSEPRRMSVVA